MVAGVGVLVPGEAVAGVEEGVEGLNAVEDFVFHEGCAEAAIVLAVVDEQRGLGSAHGGEVRVVAADEEVSGVLLDIADVAGTLEARGDGGIAGDRNGDGHALVEGAEDDGLPSAAGQSGDAQPLRVHLGMPGEIVQPLAHGEIEETDAVGSGEVEMRPIPVGVVRLGEFAEGEPLEIERIDALERLIDTALLLVLDGLAGRADVAVNVENARRARSGRLGGFVEQGRAPQAGDNFVAQLADAVAFAVERAGVFEARRGVHPFLGPAVEDDVVEDVAPEALRFPCPRCGVARLGKLGHTRLEMTLQLILHDLGRDEVGLEERAQTAYVRLRPNDAGRGEQQNARTHTGGRVARCAARRRR